METICREDPLPCTCSWGQQCRLAGHQQQGHGDHLQGRLPLAQGVHFDGLSMGGANRVSLNTVQKGESCGTSSSTWKMSWNGQRRQQEIQENVGYQ